MFFAFVPLRPQSGFNYQRYLMAITTVFSIDLPYQRFGVTGYMRSTKKWRMLLLSQFNIIRAGLKHVLAQTTGQFEIGEVEQVQDAIQKIWEENWDIVIVDFSSDKTSKLELIRQLGNQESGLQLLMVSPSAGDSHVRRGLRAGANGYLEWNEIETHLLIAVEGMQQGEQYINSKLHNFLLGTGQSKALCPPHEHLSDREYQVLCQLALGKRSVEIASDMALSPKTIYTYRKRIEEKIQLETNADFVYCSRQHGLVEVKNKSK